MAKINVTVWNEYVHEKDEKIAKIYPDGIHGAISSMLGKENEFYIKTATLEMPEHGLSDEVLNNTDVLIWCALGHANTIKFDIYADKGVISFDLNNPDVLGVCIGEVDLKSEDLHTVRVPKEFYITQEQMFIDMVNGKECKYLPTVKDGLRCQIILDALLLSDTENRWVEL